MIDSNPVLSGKFSYGWLVIAASTIITFGFYGASGSFGVFLKPLEDSLNLTRTSASSAMSIFMGMSGITGIISGWLIDKYSPRIVIAAGATIGFAGYLLTSRADSLWQLYLFFGIMTGVSMGTCFTPIIATLSKWFTHQRVLAVGITTVGISVGQMALPVLAAYFIASFGWRPAYVILALIVLITAIPAIVILGRKPPGHNSVNSGGYSRNNSLRPDPELAKPKGLSAREAVKTLPFWMFVIIGFVTAAGFYIILVHIVSFAMDMGTASIDAALILTFCNIGAIISQFIVWLLAKKLSSQFTIIFMQGLQALTLFSLIGVSHYYLILIISLVFGFGFGGSNTVRLSMISEVFGTRSAGSLIGLVTIAWSAGGLIGPIFAGYIFDISHSYNIAFLVGGLLFTAGTAAGFFLKPPQKETNGSTNQS